MANGTFSRKEHYADFDVGSFSISDVDDSVMSMTDTVVITTDNDVLTDTEHELKHVFDEFDV